MTVSIPLGGFNLSGGVKVLVIVANAMAARGWRVVLVAPDFAATSPFALAPSVSTRVVRAGPAWLPRPVRKIWYYVKLAGLAARRADLCVANYYLTAYCAIVSRRLFSRRTRVVWYVQGDEAVSHGLIADARPVSRRLRYLAARLSYRLPLGTVCVSHWVRERIGKPDAVVCHAPAIDPDVFRVRERAERSARAVIGTIGRRGETKGYDTIRAALERLPDPSRVAVVVASPARGEVELPAGVAAEAVLAHSEREMAEFYARCDVFVLPSVMEAFPLPPLEAMACGCAVVTTACGGVADYAEDGVNCLVVPVRDAERMAGAIWRLVTDEELRTRLAAQGPKTAQRFERARLAEELVAAAARVAR